MMQTIRIFTLAVLALAVVSACDSGNEGEGETPAAAETPAEAPPELRRVEVTVGAEGYNPASIEVAAGEPLVLAFTRTTDDGCGQELVIASENIRRPLPLNETVEVELPPQQAGTVRFSCGMDMYDGALVVR